MRLILTRHAKSSWAVSGQRDHDRPLNDRGEHAAEALGAWLAAQGYVPDEVLHSSALRTTQTWDRMAPSLDPAPTVRSVPALYHAGPETMLKVLQGATAPVVLMIGHNPGIAAFAAELLTAAPDHDRFHGYPTAATLVADFPVDRWADLSPRTGTAVAFITPHDL